LASVTKILVAAAVLVALEEGIVDLDDSVGPPGATLRHLLAHASGLGYEAADGVLAAPGSRRIYSNAGFELIGAHLAGRAEMTLESYFWGAICAPLEMTATTIRGSAARDGHASARDLGRFARELLAPTLIAPATLEAARTVAFPGLVGVLPGFGVMRPCDWGLGFELRDHKTPHWTGTTNAPETFGHFGQSGTFCSIDPVAGVGIVVLTDIPFGPAARRTWPVLADAVLARHRS
jgi:CubicO group peptidase (beta-lactamase class C family)